MRIFDDPNHMFYGPVRRLWIILAQLNLLEVADQWNNGWDDGRWDEALANRLALGLNESRVQRMILHAILEEMP